MKVLAVTAVVGLALGAAPVHAANMITNGSFETPVVPATSFTNFANGSAAITGWTVTGPEVSIVGGSFGQNGVSFHAQDLNQWLDLTGFNANSIEGVSQSVATTVGNQYQLSYYIGNTTGGGIFGSSSMVNVRLNGTQTFSDTNSAVNATGLTWQQITHTFTATTASTTLAFLNGDPITDNSNGLDNIVLTDLGPSTLVPEPDTYAMLLAGLGLVGWVVARRRGIATP